MTSELDRFLKLLELAVAAPAAPPHTTEAIARRIAERLFNVGRDHPHAQRLALTIDTPEPRNLGGWAFEPAVREIERGLQEFQLAAPAAGEAQPPEICICAAVRLVDGRIVRGHRHDSCFRTAEGWTPKPNLQGHVQGFLTSRNRFVDRKDGAILQNNAGIRSAMHGGAVDSLLFSEDLYFDSHDHAAMNSPTSPGRRAPGTEVT